MSKVESIDEDEFEKLSGSAKSAKSQLLTNKMKRRAVVVAQLVERLPPTPEIRGSNPVIGKLLSNICLQSTVLKRRK